ncbi:MerR family transcriptional regulator [Fodinicola feengrottensis]|uniref:MerR family transcriptional regulator n=1 Tax=Fodinicola feengrottensis TaxID=435914 RepID=UPI0013CF4013|nr:MerR family transcriptional regulator [Fodinicola feengrottensis]
MSYSIAQAAHQSGLSADTLRYYERIGLVDPPARDSGGRRTYSDADMAWLSFLTRLRITGMPIRLMVEYATLRRGGVGTSARRRQILQQHQADVRARIADLQACLKIIDYKVENYLNVEQRLGLLAQVEQDSA